MLNFDFTWDLGVSIEQMVGFEAAAAVWSHYIKDDITVRLHIVSADSLGEDGQAVGGAIPLFHEVNYGVFKEYYRGDITSNNDSQAEESLEEGNNVNLIINGEVVDGNTQMLITSAQAKALGMDQPLVLDNGTTWDRDLANPYALDGYILISQSFDWNYDFARQQKAPEKTLDFFSMALHEIGHQLGFVSGIDGTLDVLQLHSGETRVEDFTVLDLFRKTIDSNTVSDVTLGENAYFSIDGGTTNLAEFSTGDQNNNYQASHWKRFQNAIGIMDPTLAYKERLSLTELDLQAFDVLGYDVDADKIGQSLELSSLLEQAESKVSLYLGLDLAELGEANGTTDLYQLGYSRWWDLFEKQIHELGYSRWWDVFELGYQYWEQELNGETLELGYSRWWQLFEEKMAFLEDEMFALGYSRWWQEFQQDILDLGYSRWWEVFELGYSRWWQKLDTYFSKLEATNGDEVSLVDQILNPDLANDPNQANTVGGDEDDIIAGTQGKDLISGLKGDDLIDGKSGDDLLMGDEGDDMIYGFDGDDTIFGGQGDDFITGERNNDVIYGETGADIIAGGSGDDFLDGSEGKDVLKGDQGEDILVGGTEDDVLEGGEDNDLLLGGSGKDVVDGGQGDDIIYGDRNPEESQQSLSNILGWEVEAPISGVNFWLRLEAESMNRYRNYNRKDNSNASGGSVISTGGKGWARTKFTGATGVYDLVISYYDSDGGQGQLTVKVGGQEVDSWVLDQDANGFVTRTISGVTINNGDQIRLDGNSDGTEYVEVDYVDVISVHNGSTYDYGNLTVDNQLNLLTPVNNVQANTFRLEAEAMSLSNGYQVEQDVNFASGKSIISNPNSNQAVASYVFEGDAGVYNLFASYIDGIVGNAKVKVQINDQVINSWTFNKNTGLSEYRLLGTQIAINPGDEITITSQAHQNDFAQIDYLDFVPVLEEQIGIDASASEYIQSDNLVRKRIEGEQMNLMGSYNIYTNGFASGSQIIENPGTSQSLRANAEFVGATGYYDIVIGYYDGNNGVAQFNANLNGIQELDSWRADLNLLDAWDSRRNFVTRTLARGILLQSGDELELEAIRSQVGHDLGFIDYVDFIPHDPTAPIVIEAEYMNPSGQYRLEEYDFVSSGRVFRADGTLNLNTKFSGESGTYSIVVYHFDENDGQAQFSARLKGVELDNWVTNQNLGTNLIGRQNLVARTVASNIQVNNGDTFKLKTISDGNDFGRIDYVEFIPYDPEAQNYPSRDAIQLEIEDMQLTGGRVQMANFAYGGGYVSTSSGDDDEEGSNRSFTASTLFTGEEGYYNIEIGYYDTNNGEASITFKLNEDELNSWVNNQNFNTRYAEVQSFTARTVAQTVYLEKDDVLQIVGNANSGDQVNADYIKLIPVEAPTTSTNSDITQDITLSDNGDIIRGQGGNDRLFGDEGDDLLYGESEYDSPNSTNAGNDTIEGGWGNDVIYGNSGNDFLYGDEMSTTDDVVPTPSQLTFQQGVNGYSGTVDTFLQGSSPNANNSIATSLNVDNNDSGSPVHGLIRFEDIFGSQSGQIALDDTINSAVLEIEVFNEGNAIQIYEMLQTWSNTDSWNSLSNGIQANGIEASFNPVFTTTSVETGTLTIDVTSSLQAWQANPNNNYGWAFLPTGDNGVDFYSSEGSIKPRLVVDVNGSGETIKVEAENMTLGGDYFVEANSEASGGELLRTNSNGTASLSFSGSSGLYDIVVHYIDENDGNASITMNVNGVQEDSWILDQNTNADHFIHTSRTISGVSLTDSDVIEFIGIRDNNEHARIDYVEFIEIDLTSFSTEGNDILTGNSGNDNLVGGDGDDTLNGTDMVSLGINEQDMLTGGHGADTFILGNMENVYYIGQGNNDFVTVTDFEPQLDSFQIYGSIADYEQTHQDGDLLLSYQGDLVAIFQNTSSLS